MQMNGSVGSFPPTPTQQYADDGYLWARTITCPYCGGLVPLSPNWRLDSKGTGVRLAPHVDDPEHRHCTFEIVDKAKEHSPGTVKQGDGLCPYPDCGRVIDGDEIKKQAQAGEMGEQLYAVVYKQTVKVGVTKAGKDKVKSVRGFRAPRPEDDVSAQVNAALAAKTPGVGGKECHTRQRIYLPGYGILVRWPIDYMASVHWTRFFSPANFWAIAPASKSSMNLFEEIREKPGTITRLDKAALVLPRDAMDKLLELTIRV